MLATAFAKLNRGHNGAKDRIGGLPDHLPARFPVSPQTGEELAFLMQLYADDRRLPLPGIMAIQVYQIEGDYDPSPIVVSIPHGAELNLASKGKLKPGLLSYDITWDEAKESDDPPQPFSQESDLTAKSKAGGRTFFAQALHPGDRFLAQIAEGPEGLNFGGYTLIIVIDSGGSIQGRLG